MMKAFQTLVMLGLFSVTGLCRAEQINHCDDPDIGQAWQQRLAEYPGDPLVQKLVALRTGLCAMVAEGSLELSAAAQLFESEQGRSVMERMGDEAHQNRYRSL